MSNWNKIWNEKYSACTWTELNNCQGDCAYSGLENVNNFVDGCYFQK